MACGKQPVRVLKGIPGMVANRILHAQARECFYLAEIEAALPEDIDKALKYGPCFRNATTGMLEVADMGGIDVWLAAEDNMFPALCNSERACDLFNISPQEALPSSRWWASMTCRCRTSPQQYQGC